MIKLYRYIILVVLIFVTTDLHAQFNGANISSPYSIYGIGDMRNNGTAASRSLGGGGYAQRDPILYNMLNPASNSITPGQTFLFSIGAEGLNSYLSDGDVATSKNGANLGHISVRFPIYRNLGFGFSMSPYSSVGYSIRKTDRRDEVLENIGSVNYLYHGSGDIAQYKMGFGWQIFRGFSFGANFIYYLGTLKHNIEVVTNPYVSNASYATIHKNEHISIHKPSFELGFQYQLSLSENSSLIFAGVYQPKLKNKIDVDYLTTSILPGLGVDTLYNTEIKEEFAFPQKIAAGVSFVNERLNISLDYVNEGFQNSFYGQMLEENVEYKSRNTFIFGVQYTPSKFDIRSYTNRISYRFGLRYSDSYYRYQGHRIDEFSASLGFGLPLNSATFSSINVGVEYAYRGVMKKGMIQTHFLNFFVDLSLFASTQWFVKQKNH